MPVHARILTRYRLGRRTISASLRVATLLQEIYVCPLSREGEPTVREAKEVFTATTVSVSAFVDGVPNSVAYFRSSTFLGKRASGISYSGQPAVPKVATDCILTKVDEYRDRY